MNCSSDIYEFSVLINIHFTCRETEEECGLIVEDLDKVGVVMFEFTGQPQLMEVHVFRTIHYSGQPVETDGEQALSCTFLETQEIKPSCTCTYILGTNMYIP